MARESGVALWLVISWMQHAGGMQTDASLSFCLSVNFRCVVGVMELEQVV